MTEPWPFAASDAHAWPDKKKDANSDGDLFAAMLEVRKKRADQTIARATASEKLDNDLLSAYYLGAIEVAKGSLERARASAESVQKASAAIVTLYTGILALAFSATESPLPFNALFAAVLLALAVVLSTAFTAYLPTGTVQAREQGNVGSPAELADDFVDWSSRAASRRAYALRAAVLALGFSLIFLPAPFIGEVDVPWLGKGGSTAAEATAGGTGVDDAGWPALAEVAVDYPVQLQKVVYEAQVKEAEKQRVPPSEEASNGFWWIAFGLALALTFLVPRYLGEGNSQAGSSSGGT